MEIWNIVFGKNFIFTRRVCAPIMNGIGALSGWVSPFDHISLRTRCWFHLPRGPSRAPFLCSFRTLLPENCVFCEENFNLQKHCN